MSDLLILGLNLLGALLLGLAAFGIARLPDVLCRAHALTKAATLGLACLLGAMAFALGTVEAGFKATLALALQFLTIPLSGHLIARLAYRRDIRRHGHPRA